MKKKLCVIILAITLLSISLLTSFYFFRNKKDNTSSVYDITCPAPEIYIEKTHGKFPLTIQPSIVHEYPDYIQYDWDFGDNTRSNLKNPSHVYDKPGFYNVTLTIKDSLGNDGSDSVQITVLDNIPPVVSLSYDIGRKRAPMKINFYADATDSDGTIVSYNWDFDDMKLMGDQTSTEQNPTHTYWTSGTYCVKCTVIDDDDATATSMIKVDVKLNEIRAGIFTYRIGKYYVNLLKQIIS
jgi:PKD repeat protein